MKVIHITSDFANSRVYTHLIRHLDLIKVQQEVYSAVRTRRESEYNPSEICHIKKHLRHLLKSSDRLFYRKKIRKIYRDFVSVMSVNDKTLLHAHTLYSDGGVAFTAHRKLGTDFIVTVRNTDINYFMKYRPDLNRVRDSILRNASRIILLSPAYSSRLKTILSDKLWNEISDRVTIIPNGVDSFWFDSIEPSEKRKDDTLRLLYVGRFTRNKNMLNTIRAAENLAQSRRVSLTLVGAGGNDFKRIIDLVNSGHYPFLSWRGEITDRSELRNIYREHDLFVMPSLGETFGLVYIEAMSQGLPVIHTKGEGIDGYFPAGTVAEAVDPFNVEEITGKIELLADRMEKVREECIKQARQFDWAIIADRISEIYENSLSAPVF